MKVGKMLLFLIILHSLSSIVSVLGDVNSTFPSNDLGLINYFDNEISLQYSYNLSASIQSLIIIDIDYPESIISYEGYSIKIGEVDVSSDFNESNDGSSLLLSSNSVPSPIAMYNVTVNFMPIQIGAFNISWRSVSGTIDEPPSVPFIEDVSQISQGNISSIIQLDFLSGWNLIGVPVEPLNSTIPGFFSDDIDKINYIYSYNSGEYDFWIHGLPDEAQTLNNLQSGYGYWVHANEAFSMILSGNITGSPTYTDEWNLITITVRGPRSTEDILSGYDWNAIYGYSESTGIWSHLIYMPPATGTLTELYPGEGYWFNLNLP